MSWPVKVEEILEQGTDVETRLVGLIWGSQMPSNPGTPRESGTFGNRATMLARSPMPVLPSPTHAGYMASRQTWQMNPYENPTQSNEKLDAIQVAIAKEEEGDRAYDPEKDGKEAPTRKFMLTHAVCISFAMVLVVMVEMACVASQSSKSVSLDTS